MANNTLFSSIKSKLTRTDTVNEAGGRAYTFTPKHALAQMAATGCFNGVFYASAQSQLDEMRKLIDQVDDNIFLAKLAVYARERAYMKDMPAALFGWLTDKETEKWAPATEADLPSQVEGQRQRELGVPQPCVRVRSPRCDGCHGRVADVRNEPETVRHRRAEAGLHRHPSLWIDAGTRACRPAGPEPTWGTGLAG